MLSKTNNPDELDYFKRTVSIAELAQTSRFGYQIKKDEDSAKWRVLVKDDEKIIVAKTKQGQDWFVNQNDRKDKGTVLDFVTSRANVTTGEARKILREATGNYSFVEGLSGEKKSVLEEKAKQGLGKEKEAIALANPKKEGLSPEQRSEITAMLAKLDKTLHDPTYLHSRGLNNETLNNQAFKGRIFNNTHIDTSGNAHKNTVFPIYDQQGMISIEQKNEKWKGQLKDVPTGGGLFISGNTDGGRENGVKKMVITEAAVDALSHHQLFYKKDKGENTIYAATLGNLSDERIMLLQNIIDKRKVEKVELSQDNDAAGKRFTMTLLSALVPPREYKPLQQWGEVPHEKPKDIEWRVDNAGKYNSAMQIELRGNDPKEREKTLASIWEKVATLNASVDKENKRGEKGGEDLKMSIIKASPNVTHVLIEMKNAALPLAEKLSLDLRMERDLKQGIKEGFLVINRPEKKDFNDDLKAKLGIGSQKEAVKGDIKLGAEEKKEKGEAVKESPKEERRAVMKI